MHEQIAQESDPRELEIYHSLTNEIATCVCIDNMKW